MKDRACFLAHFVICLAIAGGAFFAYQQGVPQAIFAADQSYMTSVIAGLFVFSAGYIGRQAWHLAPTYLGPETTHWIAMGLADPPIRVPPIDASYGHFAVRLCVMAGLIGTSVGLSLQAKALVGGSAQFLPLATSLYTTGAGVVAAFLLEIMTWNLETGIRRAAK